MRSGPSRAAEAIVALLVPPACREEVLGDLHERYSSPRQCCFEALHTVPLVILSRIRRTTDPRALLMETLVLYFSFWAAAWFKDGALLHEQQGLLRLAIPTGMALLGLTIEDAYASPGERSLLKQIRGPLLGLALAFLSQSVLWAIGLDLSVPSRIVFYGGAMSLLLVSTVRMLFPPIANRLQGVNAPAGWLKWAGEPVENPRMKIWGVVTALFLVMLIARQLWRLAVTIVSRLPS